MPNWFNSALWIHGTLVGYLSIRVSADLIFGNMSTESAAHWLGSSCPPYCPGDRTSKVTQLHMKLQRL